MKPLLSIAIVTYRRPEELTRCLDSLTHQTHNPASILVIDNDIAHSAKPICRQFSHLSIQYIPEPQHGTANARNRALLACPSPWLGFIDDDCVVKSDWYSSALRAISTYPNSSYILGESKLLNTNNLWAKSHHVRHVSWFNAHIDPITHMIKDYTLLDTKNCLLNMTNIHKYQLKFDNRFYFPPISGQEDMDLGMQIGKLQGVGYHYPTLIVWHQETDTFAKMITKSYHRGWLWNVFCTKWHLSHTDTSHVDIYIWRHPTNLYKLLRKLAAITYHMVFGAHNNTRIGYLINEINDLYYYQGYFDSRMTHLSTLP